MLYFPIFILDEHFVLQMFVVYNMVPRIMIYELLGVFFLMFYSA